MKKKMHITFNAPVVLSFVAICLLALGMNQLTAGWSNRTLFSTYHSSLRSPLTYIRFIAHIFGHSGYEHFVGNMTYILLLGPMLEEKYSSRVLLEVIGITAVITAIINYIFFVNVSLCGASGVVFAFILMASFTSFKEGEIPLTFILVAIIFIGQQLIQGISKHDNISNMAHITGGIVGGLIGYGLNIRKRFEK